jgi:predicted phosphodiesterase
MKRKGRQVDARSLLLGVAAGAGAALFASSFWSRNPDKRLGQLLVNRALESRLRQCRQKEGAIRLPPEHRYIIFSDHHKGGRTRADPFIQCEATYLAALDHYHSQGYTLIILGDGEELLEESIERVLNAYPEVLEREARFHPDRLIRIFGNHDIHWQVEEMVREYLDPFFPGIHFRQDLVFEYVDGERTSGEIFLIHGHQGTLDSDIFSFMSRAVLPYYRDIQILTGLGAKTSPSRDACLRSLLDNRLYRWATTKSRLILIAGHTHRPVWASKTHLDKLTNQLHALMELKPEQRSQDYAEKVAQLIHEIEIRQEKYPPCDDIAKTRPCYFNSGCCQFEDGDITGIELENGVLRLIKWGEGEGGIQRTILEQNHLSEIFFYL